MTTLSDLFGGQGSASNRIDPYAQPAFVIWNNDVEGENQAIYYDHALRSLGRLRGDSDSEFSNSWGNDSCGPGSSEWNRSRLQGTPLNDFLGHMTWAFHPMFGSNAAGRLGRSGTKASEAVGVYAGLEQQTALAVKGEKNGSNGHMSITPRGRIVVGRAVDPESRSDWFETYGNCRLTDSYAGVISPSHYTMYGGVAYNERTGNIAFLESDGSYNHRPILIPGVKDPKDFHYRGRDYEAHLTQKVSAGDRIVGPYDDNMPDNGNTSGNYTCKMVLCDNNDIIMFQLLKGYGYWMYQWVYDEATGQYSGGQRIGDQHHTTVYSVTNNGYDSGGGPRYHLSLDGKTIIFFCNSYYHLSGYHMGIVNIETGEYITNFYHHNSSYGFMFAPVGATGFIMIDGERNADGSDGAPICHFNWDVLRQRYGVNDSSSKSQEIEDYYAKYDYDTPYTSTHYIAIGSFPQVDNRAIVDKYASGE